MRLCVAKPKRLGLRKLPQAMRLQRWQFLTFPPKKRLPRQRLLEQTLQRMRLLMRLKPAATAAMTRRSKLMQPPWLLPNRPSQSWPCAAMTVLGRRKPIPPLDETDAMVAVMAVPAIGVRGLVVTVEPAARVSAVVTVLATEAHAAKAEISVKTGVLVWAMPHSVRNVKPWSGLRCLCANWPRKPMVKH